MVSDATGRPDDLVIEHYPAAGIFAAELGGQKAELEYRREPGRLVFLHTEVPAAFRGKGIADKLAHAGLEFARAQGLAVVPLCPFVAAYIRRHPEYQSIVQAE